MTNMVNRSDTTTVAGAQFVNLGQPGNMLLLVNTCRNVVSPSTLNVVVSSPSLVVRPTQ